MRKEVRFKTVSAFIFFAGVLFGFNDALVLRSKNPFQEGFSPVFEDYQSNPGFEIPSYGGYSEIIYSPLVSGGHSYETNIAYAFGDVNGLPYYSKITTYDAEDSIPYYGRYPELALYQAEIYQSPYQALTPTVINTGNPYAPCLPGKYFEFSGFGVPNFRAVDESEPFEETEQPVPRFLLSHLFPRLPKAKRYHYQRRPREGYGPHNKQHSTLARLYQVWFDSHRPSKDKLKGHHNKEIKPKIKGKPHPSKGTEAEPTYVPPTINAPDDKPPYSPSQPHSDDGASPYAKQLSSEHTRPQYSYPDGPDDSHIHFPTYYDEEPPPANPHSPASRYYPEDEPYLTHSEHFPSSHHGKDQPPPAYPPYPSSPYYVEDQPPPAYPPYPSSPYYVEDQPPLSFRQIPPGPYFSSRIEPGPFSEFPSPSFYTDDIGFPFFTPLPFVPEDPGFPFFPPLPFFPDIQEPSPFPQPQTPPFFGGSFASSQFPTTIVYTTTSGPSSHNGKTKSRITVQSTSPATEIYTDDLTRPCGNKNSRKSGDKSKTSTHCWETTDNQVIVLTHEDEDDSSSEDDEETEPKMTVSSILKKIIKILFMKLITPPEPDDE